MKKFLKINNSLNRTIVTWLVPVVTKRKTVAKFKILVDQTDKQVT